MNDMHLNPNTEAANDKPNIHNIFVYGTLTSKGGLNKVMKEYNSTCRGPFFTLPRFIMFGDWVPMAYVHSQGYSVIGECWSMPICLADQDKLVCRLDMIEGHPTNYKRTIVQIAPLDKTTAVHAYMYIGPKHNLVFKHKAKPLTPVKIGEQHYHIWAGGIVGANIDKDEDPDARREAAYRNAQKGIHTLKEKVDAVRNK